jgi:chaperone modulatory protein CbpM
MSLSSYTAVTLEVAVVIDSENPIAAQALAHACGADMDWVVQLVEIGIVGLPPSVSPPHDWCFDSADLQCALEARRLERDFGVGLEAAALILDLQHEVRRLKAALQVQRHSK